MPKTHLKNALHHKATLQLSITKLNVATPDEMFKQLVISVANQFELSLARELKNAPSQIANLYFIPLSSLLYQKYASDFSSSVKLCRCSINRNDTFCCDSLYTNYTIHYFQKEIYILFISLFTKLHRSRNIKRQIRIFSTQKNTCKGNIFYCR